MAAGPGATVQATDPADSKVKQVQLSERLSAWYLKVLENETLLRHGAVVLSAFLVSLVATGNGMLIVEWMILPSWNFVLRIVGTMMGVGLGLGLASHVHDRLEVWHARNEGAELDGPNNTAQSYLRNSRSTTKITSNNSAWEEETNYASLMASAGYDVSDRVQRCQVLRRSSSFLKPFYPFTNVPPQEQHGPQIMAQQWPHLPKCISFELGCFIEHVVRDYVSSWYSIIDGGCNYENEKEKREQQKKEAAEAAANKEDETKNEDITGLLENRPKEVSLLSDRVMVWSTASRRPLPMLHTVYHTMAIMLGNLSSRVEHVNLFSLILVKWFRVLGHSFRVYRQLRRLALTKTAAAHEPKRPNKSKRKSLSPHKKSLKRAHSAPIGGDDSPPSRSNLTRGQGLAASAVGVDAELLRTRFEEDTDVTQSAPVVRLEFVEEGEEELPASEGTEEHDKEKRPRKRLPPVSEMAMAKEYLLAGKLHRAVTFGLDVPSLLFADTTGKECGVGSEDATNSSGEQLTEEEVLEKRLFFTEILSECEMDYCRILAHRFCRTLLPRSEFASPIIRTLFTELMAGSVLTSVMGCFQPDYVNDWICQGVDSMSAAQDATDTSNNEDAGKSDDDDVGMESSDENDDAFSEPDGDARDTSVENGIEMTITDAEVATKSDEFEVHDSGTGKEAENISDYAGSSGNDLEEAAQPPENEEEEGEDVSVCSFGASLDDADDEKNDRAISSPGKPSNSAGDDILPLLTMALIELQRYVDFDECREARLGKHEVFIDWDEPACRQAVRQLVLVIEGALLHGCRASRRRTPSEKPDPEALQINNSDENPMDVDSFEDEVGGEHHEAVEVSLPKHQSSSLPQVLMELTSDIEAFEERVTEEERALEDVSENSNTDSDEQMDSKTHKPTKTEVSTLRTLIAAWLHTGQVYHIVNVIARARTSVLEPFYNSSAFLRNDDNARDFVRQLKSLEGVDILVDTMDVLSSSSLNFEKRTGMMEFEGEEAEEMLNTGLPETLESEHGVPAPTGPTGDAVASKSRDVSQRPSIAGSVKRLVMIGGTFENTTSPSAARPVLELPGAASALSQRYFGTSTPRYLDFNRNEAFASSLRIERERRMKSWADVTAVREGEVPGVIYRSKGLQSRDKVIHRELHNMSRILYAGTNMIAIRNGGRRKHSEDSSGHASSDSITDVEGDIVSLLTAETASQRRRIEVPDDDSSFLLRAQPRALDPVGVHRDQRNTEQSYKSYCATYEEPAIPPGEHRYRGGRYIRRCILRYYPIDRTASIALPHDDRHLDNRSERDAPGDESAAGSSSSSTFLSSDFLRERHLCKKWYQKGAAPRSGSILTSSVMEPSDFCAVPRTGRAIDFVYRMKLFESPMVELGGKRFTVHDSASVGVHRADASSLELSDAALSTALLMMGNDWNEPTLHESDVEGNGLRGPLNSGARPRVEMGPDGYPIIFLKFKKQGEKGLTEMKPCRTSYIRASLLIASTRQSAQLQCLLRCVRAGSARNATKARTEALLWPTLKLLEFANGPVRDKQSVLLRDLKLGINHIDREQLRRNGLLQPRSPTRIVSLMAFVDGAVQGKDTGVELLGSSPTEIFFKVRCVAVVELDDMDEDDENLMQYVADGGSSSPSLFREEWVVFRSFRDFSQLHKHLKTQVAVTETSASAGARLVGAAAAALAVHGGPTGQRRTRQGMIPSLGQAKAGALGATKKTIQKRLAVLGGYLKHLTSPSHFLNRCPELLLFLGAFLPLPTEVRTGGGVVMLSRDSLGRTHMSRTMVEPLSQRTTSTTESLSEVTKSVSIEASTPPKPGNSGAPTDSIDSENVRDKSVRTPVSAKMSENGRSGGVEEKKKGSTAKKRRSRKTIMKPYIKAKIDQVSLGEVRFCIFELVRYLFDFDNASFFRSRMFQAMKTMSMAVTTRSEFHKTLYETHVKHLNPEAMAGWIRFGLDMLWPDGVFFDPKPPPTPEESKELAAMSKVKLPTAFPDQLRSVLGQDITQNGFEILHEMLQNRLVLKSMAYMLFDMIWLEIFPELQDILTCGSALDIE